MITVLLVEDEFTTREALKQNIPWSKLGINMLEDACDGLAAISLCESIRPDILLTDVRMPKMDGIQLASYVQERYPDCKIIFISGYSDKEYLKSAIHLGAVSYVEKPIDLTEITSILTRTVQLCIEDAKKQDEMSVLNNLVSRSRLLIVQELAIKATYYQQDRNFMQNLLHTCSQLEDKTYCISTAIIKLNETAPLSDIEYDYYMTKILEFLHFDISEKTGFICILPGFLDKNKLIVHCISNSTFIYKHSAAINTLLYTLFQKYEDKFEFSAVAGKCITSICQIPQSYKSALSILKKLFFKTKNTILFYEDTIEKTSKFIFNENEFEKFQHLIQNNNVQHVIEYLNHLAGIISGFEDTDIGYVKNIYFKFLILLSDTASRRNIKVELLEAEGVYIWNQLSNMETLFDINAYLKTLISAYYSMLGNKSVVERSIHDIIQYINEHFSEPNLSIKNIAEYAHYDHYYLCTLFKKNTGRTLNDYITETRIQKALDLLKDKNIKIYDITGMIGYSDPSYFTKLFKRYIGLTPSEYREKYLA